MQCDYGEPEPVTCDFNEEFECSSGGCINKKLLFSVELFKGTQNTPFRCNGVADCWDGGDEEFCGVDVKSAEKKVATVNDGFCNTTTHYLCKGDKGVCIGLERLCNRLMVRKLSS